MVCLWWALHIVTEWLLWYLYFFQHDKFESSRNYEVMAYEFFNIKAIEILHTIFI